MQDALDYISIRGFRSIREIEKLELRPINILVGANGSGKSNFVGAFAFLNAIRRGNLRDYSERRGGANRILHFGSKITSKIEIEISFRNGVNGYLISLHQTDFDLFSIQTEHCWFWNKNKDYQEPLYFPLRPIKGEAGISEPQTGAPALGYKNI